MKKRSLYFRSMCAVALMSLTACGKTGGADAIPDPTGSPGQETDSGIPPYTEIWGSYSVALPSA
ncbi:MAG: hypothetical protein IKO10_12695, partial [Lachnospiraceae bacterium]|nr:hypothetical protein [Lachnospiraceae bacterium]